MRKAAAESPRFPRSVVLACQLVTFAIICGFLKWAEFILVPVTLAILCAFVLQPVVRVLENWRVRRAPAVVLVMMFALAGVGSLGWLFGTQLTQLLQELPNYRENIKEKISGFRGVTKRETITDIQKTIREVEAELDAEKPPDEVDPLDAANDEAVPVRVVPEEKFIDLTLAEISPYVDIVFTVALMIIFAGLFLFWREDLVERLVGLAGHTRMAVTTNALSDAGSRISRYLGLQLAVNATYGLIATIGLYLLGVPYAAIWGGFAGLLRYIPYLGSILGTTSATLAALITLPGWQPVLYVFLFFCTMDILVNLAEPFVFGPGLGVSVIAVLLSVVILGWLWGPVGALLATPFAVGLVVLGEYVPALGFLSWLLNQKPPFDPYFNFHHRLLRHDIPEATRILTESHTGNGSTLHSIETVVIPTLNQVRADLEAGMVSAGEADWLGESIADILEDLVSDQPSLPSSEQRPCHLVACPPPSALDEAAMMALAWAKAELPVKLCFNHRGRLIVEVVEELRESPPQALLLLTMARDEKRQVRRWRRHLDEAGLNIPIILFSWTGMEEAAYPSAVLRDSGADEVLRGWEELLAWTERSAKAAETPQNADPRPREGSESTPPTGRNFRSPTLLRCDPGLGSEGAARDPKENPE